jgi:hypothetical protein
LTTITVLLIIIAFFTALIITVFQYFFKSKNEEKVKYWLSLLRFLSIFLILIVLINPSINKTSYQLVKPKLFVAIDNSQSIKFNKNDSIVTSLIKQVKNSKQLNSKFNINYYSFGDKIKVLDSLNFSEKTTNFSLPLETFSEIAPVSKSPIILISDGNQTLGNLDYTNFKNTIYPVIVGDTSTFEDLKITNINVNNTVNINNNFPVEIFMNYSGGKSIQKKLRIYRDKKLILTKEVNLSKTNNYKNVLIYLKAEKIGKSYYKVIIENLKNEKNIKNNTFYFSIKTINKPTKIAIVSTINHPDIGMLKRAIESKKQFEVVLINDLDKMAKIKEYQLYIFYQPTKQQKKIFENVNHLNENILIISGVHTNWNYLNLSQSFFNKNSLNLQESYQGSLNKNYSKFIIENVDFSKLPVLESNAGTISFNTYYETLLYKKVNGINTNKPLLSTWKENNRKIALFDGENIWKWRAQSYLVDKTFLNFDNFITNLIQYLAAKTSDDKLSVISKSIFDINELIDIRAIYLNENSEIDIRPKFWLSLSDEQNEFLKKIPFTVNKDYYQVHISNLKPGIYYYNVIDENRHIYSKNSFKVINFNIEEQFKNSNYKTLKEIAKQSGGKLFFQNNFKKLEAYLVANNTFKSISIKEINKEFLINYKWILFGIILLLSAEWFLRKYNGKM